MNTKPEEAQPNQSSTPPASAPSDQNQSTEKWGTDIMGAPASPSSHPNNQKAAALWQAEEHHEPPYHPYIQYSPVDQKPSNNPIEPVIHIFNSWTTKAESLARNIWQNLKTGSSVPDTLYGKVGLTTKVLTGGGFETLYKHTFVNDPNEKLKKTFACYLSTATGPVAGTLYLTNINVAFCSDRPLSFTAPSGQVAWSYYKVMIPLAKISSINPISMKEDPPEKYIQIDTIDNHDFWFMGFVNYDKASQNLSQSFSDFVSRTAHFAG
ncbi:hypothetical protein IFM89_032217 [Coptis chinensis]|uniref:GRAM domain-containing protein n=1 Tax=Coptis chinensis TaxID=261450 RepID=A0A835HYK2_9MAGN|nr:hypothetical protein IFM89_032217 [Coptis chinensis]